MILALLIGILILGGVLAWLADQGGSSGPRWISLAALLADLGLLIALVVGHGSLDMGAPGRWLTEIRWSWIPQWGISVHLAMDGLSLLLSLLTIFLGILSVGCSWTEIRERVGFFHFNILWVLAGLLGVFLAMDLFLFYFFWEMMLVPMYFLIAMWGHENRIYAAIKFFLFTQLSGLLMLVSILALVLVHHGSSGVYTFDYAELLGTRIDSTTALWLFLGFFVAFAVKLPAVPLHTWLPDAHTEAPTAGSVILAGLMLKTGAYGLLRFAVPLFPDAARQFAIVAGILGVIGILYGAVLAFAQTDLKRLVAYTSVSHLGFVLLGIFVWNPRALQGAVMQMISHGISTGALFIIVGALQERIHTRDVTRMGGLWTIVPRMGGVAMVFALASLGLPGMGNFVAEFLILLGTWQANVVLAIFATIGLVFATVYSLSVIQRAFHGPLVGKWVLPDLSVRDMAIMTAMIVGILWLGLYPQPVLGSAAPALHTLEQLTGSAFTALRR